MAILFFLCVVGDIASVAPDHDEHHGCFVDDTDNDRTGNEADEEENDARTTTREEGERKENCENGGDIVEDFHDRFDPENLEGKEVFEPFGKFALRIIFFLYKEEVDKNAADDGEDKSDNCPNGGTGTDGGVRGGGHGCGG